MKKFILTLLLVLLPLQYAQAAVCAYCCDDEAPMSSQHQPDQTTAGAAGDALADNDGDHHACGICHLSCSQYIASPSVLLVSFKTEVTFLLLTTGYQSYIPRGLDRPNWPWLA